MCVFSFLFQKTGILHNGFQTYPSSPQPLAVGVTLASAEILYMLPLYLLLVFSLLAGAILFLGLLIDIPKMIARFYVEQLGGYLFIDRKKTLKFFMVMLLPVAYFVSAVTGPGSAMSNLMEDMVLNTMCHTGVVLLLITVTAFREGPSAGAEGKIRTLKIAFNIYSMALLVAVTFVMFAGPYLTFYHFETDIARVAAFHVFLGYSLFVNYRFYRENGVAGQFGES